MIQILLFCGLCLVIDSQTLLTNNDDDLRAPTPYEFSYSAPAIGGRSTHQESGDSYGRKTGSYTVEDEDGRQRIVEYVADEDGFRASISTNEPGTSSQNPADVSIVSSADDGTGIIEERSPVPTAVIPIAPVLPARLNPPVLLQPRPYIRRAPAPIRAAPLPLRAARLPLRPAPLPFRPFPLQPALYPIEPAVFPIEPTIVPFEGPDFGPQIIPVSGRPTLYPIDNGLIQPTIIPIQDGFYPSFRDDIIRAY